MRTKHRAGLQRLAAKPRRHPLSLANPARPQLRIHPKPWTRPERARGARAPLDSLMRFELLQLLSWKHSPNARSEHRIPSGLRLRVDAANLRRFTAKRRKLSVEGSPRLLGAHAKTGGHACPPASLQPSAAYAYGMYATTQPVAPLLRRMPFCGLLPSSPALEIEPPSSA